MFDFVHYGKIDILYLCYCVHKMEFWVPMLFSASVGALPCAMLHREPSLEQCEEVKYLIHFELIYFVLLANTVCSKNQVMTLQIERIHHPQT